MRPPFRALPTRAADKARDAAAGSAVPAGQEPPPPGAEDQPSARSRGAMRRRLRKATHLREGLVRDLGALVVEMDRLGRRNDELLARKAREIEALDRELRGLAEALGQRHTVAQVVIAGIAGECAACGTLLGTEDRFCSRCGTAVARDARAPHTDAQRAAEAAQPEAGSGQPAAGAPQPAAGAAQPAAGAAQPAAGTAQPAAGTAQPAQAGATTPPVPPAPPPEPAGAEPK